MESLRFRFTKTNNLFMKINALEYLACNKEKVTIPEVLNPLPESFKLFLQYFKTGEEKDMFQFTQYTLPNGELEKFRWESTSKTKPWIIEGDRLLMLLTIAELIREIKDYEDQIEAWHTENLLKIGHTHGELILVRMSGEDIGKIFLFGQGTPHNGQEYYKTAENVFDLMHQIELKEDAENLAIKGLKPENLKRNFNEYFWH